MSGFLLGLYIFIICLVAIQSIVNLRMQLFIWGEPERVRFNQIPTVFAPPKTSFTVLLPARHEEAVIADTIDKVCHANYPQTLLQVLVICEAGDVNTIAKVREKLAQPGTECARLIVFNDLPINKPHGLNRGLQAAVMNVVTIFDAEDEPHEDIFNIINTTMSTEDIDVVQGGVHLVNYDTHWFSALNVLEYYFWFKSTLHYFGHAGIVPLGGNTVFVKRKILRQVGGWDEECLTEDADLGIRLSVAGARIRILADDDHVTREETPHSIEQLIKQRTRWHQGFIQVFMKRDWLHLPTFPQRLLAAYILMVPIIQALFAVMLPISIAMMVLVKMPVYIAMLTFVPLYAFGLQMCVDVVALLEFIRVEKREFSWRTLFFTVVGNFPYQWLLAYAAVRAIMRQLRRQSNWEKTAHVGTHRKVENVA